MVHHAAQAQCNLRPWRSGKKGGIVCGLVSVVFPVIDKGLFISCCSRKGTVHASLEYTHVLAFHAQTPCLVVLKASARLGMIS